MMIRKYISIFSSLLIFVINITIMSGDVSAQQKRPELSRKPPRIADTQKPATYDSAKQQQDAKPQSLQTTPIANRQSNPKKQKRFAKLPSHKQKRFL